MQHGGSLVAMEKHGHADGRPEEVSRSIPIQLRGMASSGAGGVREHAVGDNQRRV